MVGRKEHGTCKLWSGVGTWGYLRYRDKQELPEFALVHRGVSLPLYCCEIKVCMQVYNPYLLINKKRYAGLLWTNPDKPDKMDTKAHSLLPPPPPNSHCLPFPII